MLLLFHRTPINIPSCFCQIGDTDEPWESTPGKELLLAIGKESRLDLAERNRRRERKRMRKEWRGWFSFSRSWCSCWGANSSCKTTGMKTMGFASDFRVLFVFVWELVKSKQEDMMKWITWGTWYRWHFAISIILLMVTQSHPISECSNLPLSRSCEPEAPKLWRRRYLNFLSR